MLKQTVILTPAGAAPAQKPAGAMSSVFDTGAALPASEAAPNTRKAQERNRESVLAAMANEELSGGEIARRTGVTQSTVASILRGLEGESLVETNGQPRYSKLLRWRLKSPPAPSGFKAWLEGTAKGTGTRNVPKRAGKAAHPLVNVRTPTSAHTWHAALVSTGQVVLEANGVRLALFPDQARGIAAWITKVDAALDAALEAE